jgi:ankyrin repeat protein
LLHDAAQANDVTRVRELVAQGAPLEDKSENGCTAVWLAAAKGCTAAVTALAQLGADVNAANSTGIQSHTVIYVT